MKDWDQVSADKGGLDLIAMIKMAVFGTHGSKQSMLEIVTAWRNLAVCWQRPEWTLQEYTTEFEARYATASDVLYPDGEEHQGIGLYPAVVAAAAAPDGLDYATAVADEAKFKEYAKKGVTMFKAALYSNGLNTQKFAEMKTDISNAWTLKEDDIMPKTMAEAK